MTVLERNRSLSSETGIVAFQTIHSCRTCVSEGPGANYAASHGVAMKNNHAQ